MEQMTDSSVTLVTKRIEAIGKEFYAKFLTRRLIPEDLCADLYEQIVTRLKTYRDNNPDVKKVRRTFIHTCVNWVIKGLLKKEKSRRNHDAALVSMIRSELHSIRPGKQKAGTKTFENEICRTVGELWGAKAVKQPHVLFYVLYHAYEARGEFLLRLLSAAGLRTTANVRLVKTVHRYVKERTASRSAEYTRLLEEEYLKVYHLQTEQEGACSRDEAAKIKRRLEKAESARKHTFERLASLKVVPSFEYLAKLTGASWSTIQYGVARVERLIRENVRGV